MTLTINVPDEVAAQIITLSTDQRQYLDRVAAVALADALEGPYPLDEAAVLAAVAEGTEDLKMGRYVSLEELRAKIDAEDAEAVRVKIPGA